jgi:DNA-binding NarL/FixJ family response regulator
VRNFHCFPGGRTEPIATTKHYSIILADDHAMFRRGIKRVIEESPNLKVVGEAGDGFEVIDLLNGFIPDLVILDISMPKCGGMEASREIKKLYPGLKVMILTMQRMKNICRVP